jgi:AcrR family transcriptional regulator
MDKTHDWQGDEAVENNEDTAASAKTYHHGDLREALFEATESLLEEVGLEKFSLRECARRAGVSHAAPAYHFKNKSVLLAAYAARSYEKLGEQMARYLTETGDEPWQRMKAVGLAYIHFALEHPAAYDLMFRRNAVLSGWHEVDKAGHKPKQILFEAVEACAQNKPGLDFHMACKLAWVVTHGYVSLVFDGRLVPIDSPDYKQQTHRLAEALVDQLRPLYE